MLLVSVSLMEDYFDMKQDGDHNIHMPLQDTDCKR